MKFIEILNEAVDKEFADSVKDKVADAITGHIMDEIYVGFTNNLVRRTIQHKNGIGSEFTKKYKVRYLVFYESYQYVDMAIAREKELKKWRREKKIELIKSVNSKFNDLSGELFKDYGLTNEDIESYVKEIKSNE